MAPHDCRGEHGYVDPNFPNPFTANDACIVVSPPLIQPSGRTVEKKLIDTDLWLHAFHRCGRARSRTFRDRLRRPCLPCIQTQDMVLQSSLPRNVHGNHRLCDANPIFEERPLLCAILRGPVLLHRRRTRLLLRCHLYHPFEDDPTTWQELLPDTTQSDSVDIRDMRCRCNCGTNPRCRASGISLFGSQKP